MRAIRESYSFTITDHQKRCSTDHSEISMTNTSIGILIFIVPDHWFNGPTKINNARDSKYPSFINQAIDTFICFVVFFILLIAYESFEIERVYGQELLVHSYVNTREHYPVPWLKYPVPTEYAR